MKIYSISKIFLGLSLFVFLCFCVLAQGYDARMINQRGSGMNIGEEVYELSQEDIIGLNLMREEEKLARDVYLDLYEKWELPIFSNIASSEQTHTNAVKKIFEKYNLEDPVLSDTRGVFSNKNLSDLYNSLVVKGNESLLKALIVGATIEDLDIKDLNDLLEETNNKDIILVYENLRKGSRNHLRSFNKQIISNGGNYEAQYLSQEEVDLILNSEQERGSILDETSSIVPNFENQLVRRGTFSNDKGNRFMIERKNNQNIIRFRNNFANCSLCDNLTQMGLNANVRLSNGRNAEIKIMPETASETAISRLRLRNCDENCSIELKEVDVGNKTRAAYEVRAEKRVRVFGLFGTNMKTNVQIDAETGEIISSNKPWWAFLSR